MKQDRKYINNKGLTKKIDGEVIEKYCKECCIWKDVIDFWYKLNEEGKKFNISRKCKKCSGWSDKYLSSNGYIERVDDRRIYDENGILKEKRGGKCKESKNVIYFHKNKNQKDGYFSYCIDCVKGLKGYENSKRGLRKYERFLYNENDEIIERLCVKCMLYYELDKFNNKHNKFCDECNVKIKDDNRLKFNKGVFSKKYVLNDKGDLLQRICNVCSEYKSVSEFGKNKNAKYGVNNQCKKCVREVRIKKGLIKDRDVRRSKVERFYDGSGKLIKKQCSNCRYIKTVDEFHKGKGGKDGYVSRCKKCVKEKLKKN